MCFITSSLDPKRRGMSPESYVCLNVTLTNNGVYLINDENVSKKMNPEDLARLPSPSRIFSFNYKSIKRVIYSARCE